MAAGLPSVNVLTVGERSSGKSSLVWRLSHPDDVWNDNRLVQIIDFGKVTRDTDQGSMAFLVWDNGGGRERFRPLFTRWMHLAVARRDRPVMFVLLAANAEDLEHALEAMEIGVQQEPRVAEVPKIILATKQDVDGAITPEQVAKRLELLGKPWTETPIIPVSAKTGAGVPDFLSTLEDLARKQQTQISTPKITETQPGFAKTSWWTTLYKQWISWALDLAL